MEYLVVRQYRAGDCLTVEPNHLMTRQEAENLMNLMTRINPDCKYH